MTNPVTAAAASTAATSRSSLFGTDAGDQFNMFLKLLTTQMQNQDPLNPMDSTQYTQQLAQYSQVEQSIQQTGLLKDMLGKLGGNDLTGASGLIGRQAEFGNSVAALTARTPAQWSWSLPSKAANIVAEIRDSAGKLVASPVVSADTTSGRLVWDGRSSDGSQLGDGAYSLRLIAKDANGEALTTTVHSLGTVQDVTQRNNELWLGLGGSVSLPIADLVGVAKI